MNKERMLIIDDELEICLDIKTTFEHEGYGVDYATTAKEAFQIIGEREYDLIFVDIKLEGRVTGFDIIRSIREKEMRAKVIVVTAVPLEDLNPTLEDKGITNLIDGIIDKPGCSDHEKLIALAKRVLR